VINSNLSGICHSFRDIVSFSLENAHFSYPHPLNPEFENVPLGVDGRNFAGSSLTPMAKYSYKKFSPTPYPLATVHPLQTDGRQLMPIVRPLPKYGQLKIKFLKKFPPSHP